VETETTKAIRQIEAEVAEAKRKKEHETTEEVR